MKRAFALALLCAAGTGFSGRAYAQGVAEPSTQPEYALDGHLLRIKSPDATGVLDLGCEGRAALRQGSRLLVACGTAGVVEVDLSNPGSPRRGGTMSVDRGATGLCVPDGRIWGAIARREPRPEPIEYFP